MYPLPNHDQFNPDATKTNRKLQVCKLCRLPLYAGVGKNKPAPVDSFGNHMRTKDGAIVMVQARNQFVKFHKHCRAEGRRMERKARKIINKVTIL